MSNVVAAERDVPGSPASVYAYLDDLEQHWQLANRFVEVVSLERHSGGGPTRGGVVCMRGPLGIRRAVRTHVVEDDPPTRLAGTAKIGSGTVARVSWALRPDGERTRVRLEATVERASPLDRALLALGGRRWLERRFATILQTLERRVSEGSGQSVSA